ncbi:MAG: TetR family transcriptional regulator [bacterium]|nr:TetR family transcriptional regulator [bacterium]
MDTKQLIMKAASELFAQYGYDAVSVRDIVRKAKVNLGAITYHFGGKEALYREMILNLAIKLRNEIEKLETLDVSATEKLASFIRSYMTMLLRNPNQARMVLMEMSLGKKRLMNVLAPYIISNSRTLMNILESGIKSGEFRNVDIQLTAFHIFSVCAHFITAQPILQRLFKLERYDEPFIEIAIQDTIDFILSSLKNKQNV